MGNRMRSILPRYVACQGGYLVEYRVATKDDSEETVVQTLEDWCTCELREAAAARTGPAQIDRFPALKGTVDTRSCS